MARIVQCLVIIIGILASIIGYLYYAPNSEYIAQVDRIRTMAASMKLVQLVGVAVELVGLSNRVLIARKVGEVVRHVRNKEEDAGLEIEDTSIENVPVRIVRPFHSTENSPVIVYFHGGAFNLGSVETHNRITSTLARSANVVVISVEYRLAPEHPFPAGIDDCYVVAKYVLEHGNSTKLRVDQNRVALAGDSAGGNFAAVIAMRFATHRVTPYLPRLQILIYPALQFFDLMLPSHVTEQYHLFYVSFHHTLSLYFNTTIDRTINQNKHTTAEQKKHYRKYIDWSLIPSKYRTIHKHPITDDHEGYPNLIEAARLVLNPEVSPLLVDDEQLRKLPSTYIISVEQDHLRDETFIYEGRLKRVGVPVIHNHYEHIFHGSLGFIKHGPVSLDIAHKMMTDLVEYVQDFFRRNG